MSRSSLSAILLVGFSLAATTLSIATASEAMESVDDTGMIADDDTGVTEDDVDMTADDALAMPVPGFAVDVGCGSLTDIYENTTSHTQCKSIQVHNDCKSISYLHFSSSSTFVVWQPGQTKTYDVNVLPLEVVVLDCGGSNLDKTGCCTYAVDTCNPVPDEPVPDEPSPDEPSEG